MKKENVIQIMQLISLMIMLLSHYFNADLPLIIATMVMVVCVVLSFSLSAKSKQ